MWYRDHHVVIILQTEAMHKLSGIKQNHVIICASVRPGCLLEGLQAAQNSHDGVQVTVSPFLTPNLGLACQEY
jgi:hypothetical protein